MYATRRGGRFSMRTAGVVMAIPQGVAGIVWRNHHRLHQTETHDIPHRGMGNSARILWSIAAALCVGVAGCATCPEEIRTALLRPSQPPENQPNRGYGVSCPDRFQIAVDGRPDLGGEFEVDSDGCVGYGRFGRLRVDGQSASDIEETVARTLRTSPSAVHVRVTAFVSRSLLIFGPTRGTQRVVAYQGPETVVDFLRRTGGIAPTTQFDAVHVVRPHVADGRRPEVFPVDLRAVVIGNDTRTNVQLQPNDQVYLGETRGASVVRSLPPWLRSFWLTENKVDPPRPTGENK